MLWDGDLPEGDRVDEMNINQSDDRRLAMMVREPDPGNRDVATCPHPDYKEQLEVVSNNEDPDPLGL